MPNRLKILFVDDEQQILDGLRRLLYPKRREWNIRFATSGVEALAMLENQPADIVVTDMRMPGMTGGELLQEVLRRHPQTTRLILSGQTEQADLLGHLGCIHQHLQKPCEAAELCAAIERTFALNKLLRQPQLRVAASRVVSLPPGSESYHALMKELQKEHASVATVAEIVSRDPALSVKLMQLVNSSFFGLSRTIGSPQQAVVLLGLNTLQSIVVAKRLFDFIDGSASSPPELPGLWKSAYQIGESASRLAKVNGADAKAQQQAKLAGLLSLIGRGILLTSDPARFAGVISLARKTQHPLSECEAEIFGATQDDVTAYGIGLWGFSKEIVEAAAYQSLPSRMSMCPIHHPVGYLHLAKTMHGQGIAGLENRQRMDYEFIEAHHLSALMSEQWRKAA